MYIRTTTLGSTETMLNYIQSNQSRYYTVAEEAASGTKLDKPSDDPTAAKIVLGINSTLNRLGSYTDNIKTAQNELNVLDDTLTSITTSLSSANDLAVQAANGTYSDTDMDNMKIQVDQIIQNITDLANTQYNGNYIFSGTNTSTEAFTTATDGSITYNGTPQTGDYQRNVQISDGVSATINTTGDKLFGSYKAADDKGTPDTSDDVPASGTGILGTLKTLSAALGKHDKTAVKGCLSGLTTGMDTVSTERTKFAAVTQRFSMTTTSITSTTTNLKSYRSELQDTDLAEVATELSSAKLALQASMSVSSQMMSKMSLLDYM